MSFIDELNQVIYDLPFKKHQVRRENIAHFCEHDGICISFTRARTTWHALAPCALKPWWLFLNPLRREEHRNLKGNSSNELQPQQDTQQNSNKNKITTDAAVDAAKKIESIEVIENA